MNSNKNLCNVVELADMTGEEFSRCLEAITLQHANGKVRSGSWQEDGSLERSRRITTDLLPQGQRTPGHYFYTIRDGSTRECVGSIWLGVRGKDQEPPGAWIWDIVINENHRRKGYGRQAMLVVEKEAERLGQKAISLHVFGYNRPAIELYNNLGYETVSIVMTKSLAGKKNENIT